MFFAAARALASKVGAEDLQQGLIFPLASRMREVAAGVAAAVAAVAYEQGHAGAPRPADLQSAVSAGMYRPEYR